MPRRDKKNGGGGRQNQIPSENETLHFEEDNKQDENSSLNQTIKSVKNEQKQKDNSLGSEMILKDYDFGSENCSMNKSASERKSINKNDSESNVTILQSAEGEEIEVDENLENSWMVEDEQESKDSFDEDKKKNRGNRQKYRPAYEHNEQSQGRGNFKKKTQYEEVERGRGRGKKNHERDSEYIQKKDEYNNHRREGNNYYRQKNFRKDNDGYNGNRRNGRDYNRQDRGYDRGYDDREYDRGYRGNQPNYKRDERDQREERRKNSSSFTQIKSSKEKSKQVVIKPLGRKCWPEFSMYVMETQLSMTYRHIIEHQADVLIIPYNDLTLNIYPGNIVNRCQIDYRKKIADKGSELENNGSVYVQKCVGIDNFKALAFLRIDKKGDDIQECMKKLLAKLEKLQIPVQSVVIPFSSQMGDPLRIFKGVLQMLQKRMKIKHVTFSTNKSDQFNIGIKTFIQLVQQFITDNEICVDL